jgi:hypothetical protein
LDFLGIASSPSEKIAPKAPHLVRSRVMDPSIAFSGAFRHHLTNTV